MRALVVVVVFFFFLIFIGVAELQKYGTNLHVILAQVSC